MAKKRSKLKSTRTPVVTKQHVVEPINEESQSARQVTISQTMPPKVCRLCETKDGPFLNIFGGEKNTAKKIDDLMPFEIAENDELPHNICFRCSAKVEELHEFIQKCIKTQNNLGNAMGIPFCLILKSKRDRSRWEEKLNRSNITNDDICDAVVKKAIEEMQGSKKPTPDVTAAKPNTKSSTNTTATINATTIGEKSFNRSSSNVATTGENSCSKTSITINTGEKSYRNPKAKPVTTKTVRSEAESFLTLASDDSNIPIVEIKTEIIEDENESNARSQKTDKIPLTTSLRSSNSDTVHQGPVTRISNRNVGKGRNNNESTIPDKDKGENNTSVNTCKNDGETDKTLTTPKPFNIMDHVSMIKVNGVGVLFQCKMCNRNFLKKDVVLSHWCAKNGVPKEDFTKTLPPPDPPRVPNIKYINTNTDGSIKKQLILGSKATEEKNMTNSEEKILIEEKRTCPENRPKPKMGPASKVKRPPDSPLLGMVVTPRVPTPPSTKNDSMHTTSQVPAASGSNCRYKLVSGPNNTFTLVESESAQKEKVFKQYEPKKRKINECNEMSIESNAKSKTSCDTADTPHPKVETTKDAQQPSVSQPYPVGLIKTVPRHGASDSVASHPTPFTTSAQKKQSYTIVQTGHPNKLLISAKPQPAPVQEPVKKRQKKKSSIQHSTEPVQPFSITLEENQPKDSSDFFTFINVDPLLQPSYVLPTDNILQESQISKSSLSRNVKNLEENSSNNKYTCNLCNEKFSREKKLLAHIHSHYNKMDEEDNRRSEKPTRKRGRKATN